MEWEWAEEDLEVGTGWPKQSRCRTAEKIGKGFGPTPGFKTNLGRNLHSLFVLPWNRGVQEFIETFNSKMNSTDTTQRGRQANAVFQGLTFFSDQLINWFVLVISTSWSLSETQFPELNPN